MSNDHKISIIAADRESGSSGYSDRGLLDTAGKIFGRRVELPAEELATNLNSFFAAMNDIVAKLPVCLGEFKMEEITLSVEISAKGTVSLLGTGGELGATGGLTFTLKRPKPA